MEITRPINTFVRRIPTWVVYLAGLVPAGVYFYWAVSNQLGADPLQMLERQLGRWALQLLILTLLVTPVRKWVGVNLIKFRRAFGLLTFFYVSLHLLTWLVLDKQFFWSEILHDLYKRPYIILGMTGFVMLVPLALTSNRFSIRRLGPVWWNRLHKIGYLVVLLGAAHYLLVVKAWPMKPILYLGVVILVLGSRIRWRSVWNEVANRVESRRTT